MYIIKNPSLQEQLFQEKDKSDNVYIVIILYQNDYENIGVLGTDNGLKFVSEQYNVIYGKQSIKRHVIVVVTPQQNGLVKQMNLTISEREGACCWVFDY